MGTRTRASLSPVDLERRRLQAADLFEQGMRQSKVAQMLGVTPQAVSLWRRAWAEGGRRALLSRGPGGSSYLSAEQERELEGLLRAGPTAYGWEDQRWTLARVGVLIEERFKVRYEVSGVWRLLDRLGWSWQVPKVRAVERSEEAIAAWRTETWPAASHPRRSQPQAGGSASRTRPEPG
ncbi:winged helix-turn-helix domain-containing protein [Streptomyces sp. NBC_01264]|uniref:winged helix-turn-helix domain-containing protein n=1 Tax=Streptomyces sp. NBC_01264 TaxID=2903804 RepID=UPI0022576EBE|nr:winged helix-turn-helix domain-containing protein [Streptomyces sp. NBC_01264]MCX4784245.1 winged helix-turn-helix domain-containing protein [Streptomyces sp. NBC_01264]MCX4784537.1 winged helix-turn-helix domain-containing protein [Streptomyces sp. NBC_01264]